MRLLQALVLPLLLAVSSAASADEASDRAAIEAAAQAWTTAMSSRDASALAALATQDVILMDAETVAASGRDAARTAWLQALKTTKARLTSDTKEIVIGGDFAWRISSVTQKLAGETIAGSQCLEIWKRESGQWKIHRQMSSAVSSQRAPFSRPPPSEPVLDKPTRSPDSPRH